MDRCGSPPGAHRQASG